MGREIELKLELEPEAVPVLHRHPLLEPHKRQRVEQVSTYFDTPDGRVRSAGFSLRVRAADGRFVQTIKGSAHVTAGMFDRPEWEREIDGFAPDSIALDETPLADILPKKARKQIVRVSRSRVQRTMWAIELPAGAAEATLDEGETRGGGRRETITELELELKRGEPRGLFDLARQLARDVPLKIGVRTKDERGYALAQGTAGKLAKAEPIQLRPEMSVADGYAAVAYSCLRHFRLNERCILAKRDAAALHQARVAMRRLRSACSLFRTAIADERYKELREELRWFTGQLGDARNLDVLEERFADSRGKTGKALRARLRHERQEAYGRVLEALGSTRLRLLMLDLVGWIETGDWRSAPAAGQPLPGFAARALDNRWSKVRNGGRGLAELAPEPLHRLRIEVKKLRYAIEFFASLGAGKGARRRQKEALAALAQMQEELGRLNDQDTARAVLPRLLSGDQDALRYAEQRLEEGAEGTANLDRAVQGYGKLLKAGAFWR